VLEPIARASRIPTDMLARIGFAPSRVLNLSTTGARLETQLWLAPGRTCSLQIGDAGARVPGVVVRCRLVRVATVGDDRHSVYDAGIQFDLSAPGAREHVARLLAGIADEPGEVRLLHAG